MVIARVTVAPVVRLPSCDCYRWDASMFQANDEEERGRVSSV
jgi:hypothetical protein